MFKRIVKFALRFRGVIVALACVLAGFGVYSILQARYDVYPDFTQPQLKIKTRAPGLSPSQVEKLVTRPMEQALSGAVGAKAMFSNSLQGISVVKVLFPENSDIYHDEQLVDAQLANVSANLPPGVFPPVLRPLTAAVRWVTAVGLTDKTVNLRHLRTAADWVVKPALLAARGVVEVVVYGGYIKQYQIQIRPHQLVRYGLSLDQVLAAARQATGVAGAGFIDTPNQRLTIRLRGQSFTARQLARTVVLAHGDQSVTLGDVAHVVIGHEPPVGAATIMGKPGVIMMVGLAYGANLLRVSGRVQTTLQSLQPALAAQGIVLHRNILNSSSFVTTALHNLLSSLLIGGGLIILVLVFFLGEWRTAVISCLAIPLSLLAAIVILVHAGLTLNTMTLGGLAVAIGEVVDDAVIDVENITRRLRENGRMAKPRSSFSVVLAASVEVRTAVVYATLAVIMIFLPVLALTGLAGRFFAPMGVAYIAAVLSSLILALTLTPALCLILLRGEQKRQKDSLLVRGLRTGYGRLLAGVERQRTLVITAVGVLTIAGLAILPFLGSTFLPRLNERNYVLHMDLVSGTSLRQSIALGNRVTRALLKIPYVQKVSQRAGRASLGGDIIGPQYSQFIITVQPLSVRGARRFRAAMDRLIRRFPAALMSYNSVLTERINETLSGSGSRAPVAVELVGNNLKVLNQTALRIAQVLRQVRGAGSVTPQALWAAPQIMVRLRHRRIARWGLRPMEVLQAVEVGWQGRAVGKVYQGVRMFRVVGVLPPAWRHHVKRLKKMPIRAPDGAYVPLDALARVYETRGRYMISHLNGQRAQTIAVNVRGRSVGRFVAAAEKRVARAVHLPTGVYVLFTGAAEAEARAQHELIFHGAMVLAAILLLLSIALRRLHNVLLLLVNLPMALAGGVAAVWFTGGVLSLGDMVGFITLLGITLRNSIMLLSHYQHLVEVEKRPWNTATAIEGAVHRLPAILMTALVTGLGMLPLALGSGAPGREIEGPLAQVIVGGLLTSTLLNLLVLPTLAARFGKFGVDKAPA